MDERGRVAIPTVGRRFRAPTTLVEQASRSASAINPGLLIGERDRLIVD
jgi:hypothetical protein